MQKIKLDRLLLFFPFASAKGKEGSRMRADLSTPLLCSLLLFFCFQIFIFHFLSPFTFDLPLPAFRVPISCFTFCDSYRSYRIFVNVSLASRLFSLHQSDCWFTHNYLHSR